MVVAVLVGGYVRLCAPLASDFPPNDDGLFYAMMKDLQQSAFILPDTTSYTELQACLFQNADCLETRGENMKPRSRTSQFSIRSMESFDLPKIENRLFIHEK